MGLREYRRRRDFAVTPEPRGAKKTGTARAGSYCIQKHAASHLHYDFRLELDAVLKSWAVPKGPSLDPSDKRLAMQVEDHPVDYGDFEGNIPKGEYGGGTVLLWDRGTWEPSEDPHKGLQSGALKFRLNGEKLKGGWALVRIRGREEREGRTWLLIKEKDRFARPGAKPRIVDDRPESVSTGRWIEQVARTGDRVWHSGEKTRGGVPASGKRTMKRGSAGKRRPATRGRRFDGEALARAVKGARAAALPRDPRPQLATLVTEAPPGDEWVHEIKYDGYRLLARIEGRSILLLSRRGHDWAGRFPEVVEALRDLPVERAVLDGEIAVVRPDGVTSFQALQNALNAGDRQGQLAYFLFDLLHLEGWDLTGATLIDRKETLRRLVAAVPRATRLRYSEHVVGSGEEFFREACRMGVEGIVSKRGDAHYQARRGREWLKVKCHQEQEAVIGGWTDPEGSRVGFGALLLGAHEDGALRYIGKVGTGFSDATLADLQRLLNKLSQTTSPFAQARIPGVRRAHWVRPELVAEIRFTEWTKDGRMRHPSFQGLREDKPARSVVRELPDPTDTVVAGPSRKTGVIAAPKAAAQRRARPQGEAVVVAADVRLTSPNRVLYAQPEITKLDLARFYESIARWILPHLKGRPLTLVRCPEGQTKECFYMKHAGAWAPKDLRRVRIQEKTKVGEYLVVDDVKGLIGLVQMSILEMHTWNSTVERLERPDRVVFDLDPDPTVAWVRVVEGALLVRDDLSELGLESFVKTSGGKGLHIVVPLRPGGTWQETFEFSRAVAQAIEKRQPRQYTTAIPKAARRGKILIDYLRNNRGSTTVVAYSTRARPGAPISTPITWDEARAGVHADQFNVSNLATRLETLKVDPWARYWTVRQRLTAAMQRAVGHRRRS